MDATVIQTNDPVELIGDISLHDPLATALLVIGIVIFAYTMGVVGYLTAGAAVDVVLRPIE